VIYTIKYVSAAYLVLAPSVAIAGRREHGMEKAAIETGGLAFDHPKRLDLVYSQVEKDLRSQYGIGYAPGDDSDPKGPHRLQVRTSRPEVRIRLQSKPGGGP